MNPDPAVRQPAPESGLSGAVISTGAIPEVVLPKCANCGGDCRKPLPLLIGGDRAIVCSRRCEMLFVDRIYAAARRLGLNR